MHAPLEIYTLLESRLLHTKGAATTAAISILKQLATVATLCIDVKRAFWNSRALYKVLMSGFRKAVRVLARDGKGRVEGSTAAEVVMGIGEGDNRKAAAVQVAAAVLPWPFAKELCPADRQCVRNNKSRNTHKQRPEAARVDEHAVRSALMHASRTMDLLTAVLFDGDLVPKRRLAVSGESPYRFNKLLQDLMTIPSLDVPQYSHNQLMQSLLPLLWEFQHLLTHADIAQQIDPSAAAAFESAIVLELDKDLPGLASDAIEMVGRVQNAAAAAAAAHGLAADDCRRVRSLVEYFERLRPELMCEARRIYGRPWGF
ncbi:hypothetical protein HDU86_002469 [Geranomyces michiganensis]|nr:hypothetical protein HDU86_002469 [Geranomyces michiganensis]